MIAAPTARLVALGHNVTLFGRPRAAAPTLPKDLTLEHVASRESITAYAEVYLTGFGLLTQRERRRDEIIERSGNPAHVLTLARASGVAVGVGGLTVARGVGYLGPATTLPSHRGQGIQTVLIAHRLAQAHALGCEYVVATASFASSSQHNLERAGLRVLQTKSLWRPPFANKALRAIPPLR